MSDMTTQRVLVQRVVPAYKVALLAALADGLGLTVLHAREAAASDVPDVADPPIDHVRVGRVYAPGSTTVVWLGVLGEIWRRRPDVVIVEGSLGILSNYALLLLRPLMGFALVAWTFGFDPSRGLRRASIIDRVRIWFYRRCDAVVVYWQTGANAITAAAPDLTDRVFVARNVIGAADVEPFWDRMRHQSRQSVRSGLGIPADEPLVSFVGRLTDVKRPQLALQAFADATRALDGVGSLAVIGAGSLDGECRAVAERLGLQDRVRFVGRLTPADTARWLYASDVVVVPGRLGLVVCHAAAFGTPVMSLASESAFHGEGAEFLVDGVTGIWCTDPMDMAERLRRLLEDAEERDRLHAAARDFYERELTEASTVMAFADALGLATGAVTDTPARRMYGSG